MSYALLDRRTESFTEGSCEFLHGNAVTLSAHAVFNADGDLHEMEVCTADGEPFEFEHVAIKWPGYFGDGQWHPLRDVLAGMCRAAAS